MPYGPELRVVTERGDTRVYASDLSTLCRIGCMSARAVYVSCLFQTGNLRKM